MVICPRNCPGFRTRDRGAVMCAPGAPGFGAPVTGVLLRRAAEQPCEHGSESDSQSSRPRSDTSSPVGGAGQAGAVVTLSTCALDLRMRCHRPITSDVMASSAAGIAILMWHCPSDERRTG
jgi:hypothetical protein